MVLLFKGIAPLSQFPATSASAALPTLNHACFRSRVDVCMFRILLEEQGGEGLFASRAVCLSYNKKKALSVHSVPTTSACRPVARGRKSYINPAFSGIPKQEGTKSELAPPPPPPAFLGVQKVAEMLHRPCILGGPQQKGDKINSQEKNC